MKHIRTISYTLAGILFLGGLAAAASSSKPALETVPYVDLERYMGTWYEIARFPQYFERGCNCSKANYSLNKEKGYVTVVNECRKNSVKGKLKKVQGKAFVQKGSGNARLKVQFQWPFKGDYYIIDLAPDYSYAMVGHPNRKYLWILCREREMSEDLYESLVEKARAKGFDVQKLERTVQGCES